MRTKTSTTGKIKVEAKKGPCKSCKKKPEVTELPELIEEKIDIPIVEEKVEYADLSKVYIPSLLEVKFLWLTVKESVNTNKPIKEDDRDTINKIYSTIFMEPFDFTRSSKIDEKQYNNVYKLAVDTKVNEPSIEEMKLAYAEASNPLGIHISKQRLINDVYKYIFDEEFDFGCRSCINVQVRRFRNYLINKKNIKRL